MSLRKYLSVVSLAFVIPLSACDEEDDPASDGAVAPAPFDSGVSPSDNDGSTAIGASPDAGTVSSADAGAIVSVDGGQKPTDSTGDAGGPATPKGARFFLPTIEPNNTSAPRVEIDTSGNVHSVYPAYVRGGAYYSVCGPDCSSEEQVKVVEFETDGTVGNAMLTLTPDGKPRILLSAYAKLYWAQCDQGCSERANWQLAEILDHGSDRAVTGEALTLDPQGHPRFLMHTYRALFGIGQKPAQTLLAKCDSGCDNPASWTYDVIATGQIWEGSTLRYDAGGEAHVATHVYSFGDTPAADIGAYISCKSDCAHEASWNGVGFFPPYESMTEAVNMKPAISLALTKAGQPRLVQLGKTPEGKKIISYFECNADDCTGDVWKNGFSWTADQFDDGVDLALDADDHPRFVHTINYDIALTYCDAADCTAMGAGWDSAVVERGSAIPPDEIFLEWNCTIGAWFLHTPSIAIAPDGKPRVGYQSRDVSGGTSRPDPNKPACVAGTDMTWSRLAIMESHKQ
jgi:hypothetical protein